MSRASLREMVDQKCKDCIYDEEERGTWREQVAACTQTQCPLFDGRPVPRSCMKGGSICPKAVQAVREKLQTR